jgi:hypothetical protein
VLETDASDISFGAVLMQEGHPVAYLSKSVCAKNQALSTYEKECMAIITVVEKWRACLQHQEFIIKTDHRSLLHMSDQRVTTKLQQKALLKLMDLQFKIQYKKGTSKQVDDSLSRCSSHLTVTAIAISNPEWLARVKEGYDPIAVKLLKELSDNPGATSSFSLHDGIVRHKGRVWMGNNKLAQQYVVWAMHNSAMGGHSGVQATYYRIRRLFTWPRMKGTIYEFIKSCAICQQAKVEHTKPTGLLQPLPVP